MSKTINIDIVVPCYKVGNKLSQVINSIPLICRNIYIVDDCCPEGILKEICFNTNQTRVKYLSNKKNLGVGGATLKGMTVAFNNGADIVIKIDGDGQMDAGHIHTFIRPLIDGSADYVKGNRFSSVENIRSMPINRIILNLIVTLLSKISSGYWNINDPTNGYIAISRNAYFKLKISNISKRYFFESDMLMNLYLIRAFVIDIPIKALYFDEKSNIKIFENIIIFSYGYLRNFLKRIFTYYFMIEIGAATIYFLFGILLFFTGSILGLKFWLQSYQLSTLTSAGSVMISALPLIFGLQFLLAFLSIDLRNIPKFSLAAECKQVT